MRIYYICIIKPNSALFKLFESTFFEVVEFFTIGIASALSHIFFVFEKLRNDEQFVISTTTQPFHPIQCKFVVVLDIEALLVE